MSLYYGPVFQCFSDKLFFLLKMKKKESCDKRNYFLICSYRIQQNSAHRNTNEHVN